MNKKLYIVLTCLTCAFGIKGMHHQQQQPERTGDEISAIGELARAGASRAQQNLPTYLTVYITGINNTLDRELEFSTPGTVDVLRPGQNFTGTFPLTHKGTAGFPTLIFKVEGTEIYRYRPSGDKPRVKFAIVRDEIGEIKVKKIQD